MAGEPKKISFGFSKISKKPTIVPQKKEENEIQFIESMEGNSIKLVNGEEQEKGALVIPLKNANVLRDSMIETLKARKEERALKQSKATSDDTPKNGNGVDENAEKKPLTLDELAAKEILEDLKKSHEQEENPSIREIPTSNISTVGEKESTLEDYENVPVQEFGLAVLRGMGWAPDKGIGKNSQIVEPVTPVLRPKGMGLGADKVVRPTVANNSGEELVMKKNALLKIISGPNKDLYGKVEGFDELPGRLMVRLTIQNNVISISENLVQLVTSQEYNKNSKILNLSDYNKFKDDGDKPAPENEGKLRKNKMETTERNQRDEKQERRRSVEKYKSERYDSPKKERRKSRSPYSDKRDTKARRERRSVTPDSDDSYTKPQSRKKQRSPSSDSDERGRYRKESKSFKYDKGASKKTKTTRSRSSDSEDEPKKYKRRNRSSSSESEERSKKSKIKKRRSPSSSSDDRRGKSSKKSRKRDSSESEEERRKKKKSTKKKYDNSSSDESEEVSNHKQKYKKNRSDSSDSDSSEPEVKKSKYQNKKSKSRNDSPHRSSKHKKHKERHSRSKSPSSKKKRKKHRRSRS